MRKGKIQGQSQTILGFVESDYEKVTTKRMCGIFSTEGEVAKEKFRKLEAMNSVCSTGDNEEMNLACSFSRHKMPSG